jgi:hypothetical protein
MRCQRGEVLTVRQFEKALHQSTRCLGFSGPFWLDLPIKRIAINEG